MILIDSGYLDTLHLVIDSIYKLGFSPYDIKYIINTHWHIDHTQATKALADLCGAKTLIGERDKNKAKQYFDADISIKDGDMLELACQSSLADIVKDYILLCIDKNSIAQKKTKHWAVENMLCYIEKYSHNDISIKSIARLYHFNEKYFGRLFKKQTGISFREYLCGQRLKKALTLLKTSQKSITEIAYLAGFSDASYFDRAFRSKYKIKPSLVRKGFEL